MVSALPGNDASDCGSPAILSLLRGPVAGATRRRPDAPFTRRAASRRTEPLAGGFHHFVLRPHRILCLQWVPARCLLSPTERHHPVARDSSRVSRRLSPLRPGRSPRGSADAGGLQEQVGNKSAAALPLLFRDGGSR